ncbi:MAG: SGNH/GDSL hydrolase family protein [Sedimenticola sp.]
MFVLLRRFQLFISPRQKEVGIALLLPFFLLIIFISGETLVRLQQHLTFGNQQVLETDVNTQTWEKLDKRRRPRPNARLGQIKFSSDGFRGKPMQMPKPENTVRIGFFGSSTTIDLYVHNDADSWPAVALQSLSETYPNCDFDFFNAGVPGYNIKASQQRFNEDALPYKLDIAVFLLSDVSGRVISQLRKQGDELQSYRPSKFAQLSLLWLKIEKNVEALRLQRLAARDDISLRINQEMLKAKLRKDASMLAKTTLDAGVLPVFVENASRLRREQATKQQIDAAKSRLLYMPGIYIRDVTEALYNNNTAQAEVARELDIPMISTIKQMPSDAKYYADSSHTSQAGSRIFGRLVGKGLANDPRIISILTQRCGDGTLSKTESNFGYSEH